VVFDELVHAAGEIQGVAVRQVPAMRQGHAQHRVTGTERGHVHGDVRGSAGVGLHVGVLRAEEFLGAIDGQLFHLVGIFAPAVIAPAGIALGVFVGEDGAHGFQDGFRDKIFGGDEFKAGGLTHGFLAQQFADLAIDSIERALHAGVGFGGHEGLLRAEKYCSRLRRDSARGSGGGYRVSLRFGEG